jgi:hypothetical protein
MPALPPGSSDVANGAARLRAPDSIDTKTVGQTKSPIVAGNERWLQFRVTTTLIVFKREQVAQWKDKVEWLCDSGFL